MNTSKEVVLFCYTLYDVIVYPRWYDVKRLLFFFKKRIILLKEEAYSNGGTDYGGNQKDKAVGADL